MKCTSNILIFSFRMMPRLLLNNTSNDRNATLFIITT